MVLWAVLLHVRCTRPMAWRFQQFLITIPIEQITSDFCTAVALSKSKNGCWTCRRCLAHCAGTANPFNWLSQGMDPMRNDSRPLLKALAWPVVFDGRVF